MGSDHSDPSCRRKGEPTFERWEEIFDIMKVTIPIMLVLYAVLLMLVGHNVLRFMIRSEQLRSLQLAYFYFLITIVVIIRVYQTSVIFLVTDHGANNHSCFTSGQYWQIMIADSVASNFELLVGIQQTGAMAELYFMIKKLVLIINFDSASLGNSL